MGSVRPTSWRCRFLDPPVSFNVSHHIAPLHLPDRPDMSRTRDAHLFQGAWVLACTGVRCWRHHRLWPYNKRVFAWVGCCERMVGETKSPTPSGRGGGCANSSWPRSRYTVLYKLYGLFIYSISYVCICMNICIRRKGLFFFPFFNARRIMSRRIGMLRAFV